MLLVILLGIAPHRLHEAVGSAGSMLVRSSVGAVSSPDIDGIELGYVGYSRRNGCFGPVVSVGWSYEFVRTRRWSRHEVPDHHLSNLTPSGHR